MLAKRWTIIPADEQRVLALQEEYRSIGKNVHAIVCRLLVQRGIYTVEEAKKFFIPDLTHLHDPFTFRQMQTAVDRIAAAMANNEAIMVYGDYDVDGTTAVALTYGFLKDHYPNVSYYIPCRYKEGYGVSMLGIESAAARGAKLIIALDCGITAIEQVKRAKELGMDFIICDHHKPGDQLPDALAILNPKVPGDTYPYDELSGCGIGFKLAQALCQHFNWPSEDWEKLLDLVVVSIASDLVPVTGENRVLAYYGLKRINHRPRPGIKALMEMSKIQGEVNINSLVFVIGPRINAAGRIEHGNDAVKLLLAPNADEAYGAAQTLNTHNNERKDHDRNITEEALQILNDTPSLQNKKTTVLVNEGWHKGVIGIVASRLMDHYYRPTIVMTQSNGSMTGSVRSVKDFDVYEALKACSHLLEKFGGHKYAAGLSLPEENFEAFCNAFEKVVSDTILPEQLIPEVSIDAEIEISDCNLNFYTIVEHFGPFGPGNLQPTFVTRNVADTGRSALLNEKHLKLNVDKNKQGPIGGIIFERPDLMDIVQRELRFDVAYHFVINEWKGNKNVEWRIKDIKPSENN